MTVSGKAVREPTDLAVQQGATDLAFSIGRNSAHK